MERKHTRMIGAQSAMTTPMLFFAADKPKISIYSKLSILILHFKGDTICGEPRQVRNSLERERERERARERPCGKNSCH